MSDQTLRDTVRDWSLNLIAVIHTFLLNFKTYSMDLYIIYGVSVSLWFHHKILRIGPNGLLGPCRALVSAGGWHPSICRS